ncbi:MAG: LptE family protein [Bacteroidales bacterium]|nr:LptE family protein [Bacteroidales bacterium]
MMKTFRHILSVCAIALTAMITGGCGIYSFSGTSIQPDVKTITINFFEYTAEKVNPSLSNQLTEELRTQFRKMTRLEQVDLDGDLEIEGAITGYDVQATAVTADEVAARNRLNVTVKITFTNRLYPEDNLEQNFSAYEEYDSMQSLDSVQDALCVDIVKKLVEDIFNATVAQW